MNKTRIIGLVVGAAVVVGVILIALGFKAAPEALGSNPAFTGFGDLRSFENQLERASGGAQSFSGSVVIGENIRRSQAREALMANKPASSSISYAGMGDVQRIGAVGAESALSSISIKAAYAGMGDVQRVGAVGAESALSSISNSAAYAGMGDVQRFGALTAGTSSGILSGSSSYAGMGDLQRLEYLQDAEK